MQTTSRHLILICVLALLFTTGCSSIGKQWHKLVSGDSQADNAKPGAVQKPLTYNQQNNVMPGSYRQYKRTTRSDLENQSHLEGKSGSLWVMEGQGAYLFSQNIVRMIGDPIAVKLDGDPNDQLSAKAKVISKLLAQLEDRRRRALGGGGAGARGPADDGSGPKPTDGTKPDGADKKAPGEKAPGDKTGAQAGPTPPPGAEGDNKEFAVKLVPTRVVERMVDGNYRVRGMQSFMIGQREYKVIVAGIVRAEDFNEEGINSTQLLDSSFDIVSAKGAEMRQ